jgi:sugar-specific transcriptional regulator TrmB
VDERLVELLGIYGLSEREARTFVFLTRNGACGAGDLARAIGIRRMEAYRLLKRLLERGIVVSTAGKPIRYQAETLDGVVSLLTDEQKGVVRRMEEARGELAGLWKQVPRAPVESFEQKFRIIQGREQIYNAMTKMVELATESLDLVLTRNDITQAHVLGIGDKIVEAARRGVKVSVVAPVDGATLEAADSLAKAAELRHSEEAPRSRLVVADGAQTLVSLVLDDTKGAKNDRDVAIWTDSKDYAETMAGLYRVSFAKAEDAGERIARVRSQMRFAERTTSMVAVVRDALSDRGWKVEAPGMIRGASGAEFEFAAVLSGPDRKKFGLDVVFGQKGGSVAEKVAASALKKLELKDAGLVIVATPGPDEQTTGLARLLGASVVDGSDAVDAAAAIRNSVAGDT